MNNPLNSHHQYHKQPYTKTIGFKLTINYLIATLFVLSMGLFFSLKMVQNNYSLMVRSQFHDILSVHEYIFEQYFVGSETWAKHLASEHEIQTIFSDSTLSKNTTNSFFDEHNVIFFENTYINILNSNASVIYCSNNCDYSGDSLLGIELIRQVSNSLKINSAIVSIGNEFAFYSVAPVFDNKTGQTLLGFIIVGKKIDDKYVSSIKIRNDSVDIAIVRDRAIMASTIKINETPLIDIPLPYLEYLGLLKKSNDITEIEFQKKKYFVSAKKINRMSKDATGSIMLLKARNELEQIEIDLVIKFIHLCLLSLVIIIVISTGIARRLLTPISNLTEASIKIANGKLGIKAKVESNDEIAVLAENFNSMLSKIEKQHDFIQKQNDSLEERVKQRTHALNKAMNDLRTLTVAVEQSPVSMMITNNMGVIEYVNPKYTDLSGYSKEEIIGKTPEILKSRNTADEETKKLWQKIESGDSWQGEFYNQSKDGSYYWERILITPIMNDSKEVTHYLGSIEDITNIKEYERQLIEQATYDSLTNLPNRLLAEDRLNQAISSVERNATKGALMFIDLDDFKKVNDTLGHHAGDELLKRISILMSEAVRNVDTVARIGGDEFLIILKNINSYLDAEKIARKVIALASKKFIIDNKPVFVSASIGISIFPDDDIKAKNLMRKADTAMYLAKKQGKNSFIFSSADLNEKIS